jgi:hypothetical protein
VLAHHVCCQHGLWRCCLWLKSLSAVAAQADVSRRVVALQGEAARLARRPDLSADDRARILTDRHAAVSQLPGGCRGGC